MALEDPFIVVNKLTSLAYLLPPILSFLAIHLSWHVCKNTERISQKVTQQEHDWLLNALHMFKYSNDESKKICITKLDYKI